MSDPLPELEQRLREQPEDWESWLVYADRLLERGDPRGELVGLAHRLATAALPEPERQRLQRELWALEEACQRARALPEGTRLSWRHGFVLGLSLRRLGLAQILEALRSLSGAPEARLLGSLDLGHGWLGDAGVAELVRSGLLSGFSALSLRDTGLTDASAQELGSADSLGALRSLDLARNRLGPQAARALVAAPWLGGLRSLDLHDNPLGDEGAAALAGAAALSGLERLSLWNARIGPKGAAALATSRSLGSLVALNLAHNPLGEAGAAALRASPALRSLQQLDLRNTHGP